MGTVFMWPGGIGTGEVVILIIVILIIFGVGKLPQIGDALGKGIKNFKKALSSSDEEEQKKLEKGVKNETSNNNKEKSHEVPKT